MLPPECMPPKKPPARTFVKRGFYMCCTVCGLAVDYCACGNLPAQDAPAQDGSESGLNQRIADCKESS